MRRIRQSANFKIKDKRQLRNPHITEMEKVETPRFQKISNELSKNRRNQNSQSLNQESTQNSGSSSASGLTGQRSHTVKNVKPDSNSLAEQSESIKTIWFCLCRDNLDTNIQPDATKVTELPLSVILDFLVKEGVSLDRDKARQVVNKQIGEELMSENKVSDEEFDKLFCKGMFKKALIKIA